MPNYGKAYFEQVADKPGLNTLSHNTCRLLDFKLLVLTDGEAVTVETEGSEYGFVVLTGVVDIHVGDESFEALGGRKTVFAGPPSMVYTPAKQVVRIVAKGRAEVALCSAPSTIHFDAYRLDPYDAISGKWGQYNTVRTFDYMINGTRPSEKLHLAEVTVESGNWATYPPHKHDEHRPELGEIFQEEMYFYRVDDPKGFGFCASYGSKADDDYAFMVRNNALHKMPAGYHTVCAAPGYKVWYLAAIAGDDKGHAVFPDPDHTWYFKAETALQNVNQNLSSNGR